MRRKTLISVLFSFSIFVTLFAMCAKVSEKDQYRYYNLLEASSVMSKQDLISSLHKIKQNRNHVYKSVYLSGQEHSKLNIQSEDSVVFCFHHVDRLEVVEQMGTVCCIIEKQCSEELKKIEVIEAENASLNYNEKLLIGHDVLLRHYELHPNQTLKELFDQPPLFTATAQNIELNYENNDVQLKASCLKTLIDTKVSRS